MKYASFAKLEDLELYRSVGFDGVELDSCQLRKLDDGEFRTLKQRLKDLGLEVCACSWIMENTVHICDGAFDREGWLRQFRRDAARLSELGCPIMVFAAGPIRTVGHDQDTARKKEIINSFILETAEVFETCGVKLALETVCGDYTDYLTALSQWAQLCQAPKAHNLYLLTDIRHLVRAGDEPEDILRYQDRIIHAHIDNPIDRARHLPLPGDGYSYDFFLRRVVQTRTQWISFECHDEVHWLTQGAASLASIRSLVEKYQAAL